MLGIVQSKVAADKAEQSDNGDNVNYSEGIDYTDDTNCTDATDYTNRTDATDYTNRTDATDYTNRVHALESLPPAEPLGGVWGGVDWRIDAEGTLTLSPSNNPETGYTSGQLPSTQRNDDTQEWNIPWKADGVSKSVKSINITNKIVAGENAACLFSGTSITNTNTLQNLDVSHVRGSYEPSHSSLTGLADMFAGCQYLSDLSGLASWDVSGVINMSGMFGAQNSTDVPLPLSSLEPLRGWDVSSCVAFYNMFVRTAASLGPLASWNVENGLDFSTMFLNGGQSICPISGWKISPAARCRKMFSESGPGVKLPESFCLPHFTKNRVNEAFENIFLLSGVYFWDGETGNKIAASDLIANWDTLKTHHFADATLAFPNANPFKTITSATLTMAQTAFTESDVPFATTYTLAGTTADGTSFMWASTGDDFANNVYITFEKETNASNASNGLNGWEACGYPKTQGRYRALANVGGTYLAGSGVAPVAEFTIGETPDPGPTPGPIPEPTPSPDAGGADAQGASGSLPSTGDASAGASQLAFMTTLLLGIFGIATSFGAVARIRLHKRFDR